MCAAKFIADSSLPVSTTVVIHASSTPCALVVTALGYGLMMTAPHRPTEHCFPAHRPPGQDHSAQELAHYFGDRQLHESPRFLLKESRLLCSLCVFAAPFCSDGSKSIPSARMAARKAWAKRARVMCRYQPCQLLTS